MTSQKKPHGGDPKDRASFPQEDHSPSRGSHWPRRIGFDPRSISRQSLSSSRYEPSRGLKSAPLPDQSTRHPQNFEDSEEARLLLGRPSREEKTRPHNSARESLLHIIAFEEGLKLLAEEVASCPDWETGGSLFGHVDRQGNIVVDFICPPGPDAQHSPCHFSQSLAFFHSAQKILKRYGIDYLGDWHSHQRLSLDHPSGEDAANMASISRRNSVAPLVQIIANLRPRPLSSLRDWGPNSKEDLEVHLNAYVYPEIGSTKFVEADIELLEGKSPMLREIERIDPENKLHLQFATQPVKPTAVTPAASLKTRGRAESVEPASKKETPSNAHLFPRTSLIREGERLTLELPLQQGVVLHVTCHLRAGHFRIENASLQNGSVACDLPRSLLDDLFYERHESIHSELLAMVGIAWAALGGPESSCRKFSERAPSAVDQKDTPIDGYSAENFQKERRQ